MVREFFGVISEIRNPDKKPKRQIFPAGE